MEMEMEDLILHVACVGCEFFFLGPHLREDLFQRILFFLGSPKGLIVFGGGHGVVWPTITNSTTAAFLVLLK